MSASQSQRLLGKSNALFPYIQCWLHRFLCQMPRSRSFGPFKQERKPFLLRAYWSGGLCTLVVFRPASTVVKRERKGAGGGGGSTDDPTAVPIRLGASVSSSGGIFSGRADCAIIHASWWSAGPSHAHGIVG